MNTAFKLRVITGASQNDTFFKGAGFDLGGVDDARYQGRTHPYPLPTVRDICQAAESCLHKLDPRRR